MIIKNDDLCLLIEEETKKSGTRPSFHRRPAAAKIAYEMTDRKRLSSAVPTLVRIYKSKILNSNYEKILKK